MWALVLLFSAQGQPGNLPKAQALLTFGAKSLFDWCHFQACCGMPSSSCGLCQLGSNSTNLFPTVMWLYTSRGPSRARTFRELLCKKSNLFTDWHFCLFKIYSCVFCTTRNLESCFWPLRKLIWFLYSVNTGPCALDSEETFQCFAAAAAPAAAGSTCLWAIVLHHLDQNLPPGGLCRSLLLCSVVKLHFL